MSVTTTLLALLAPPLLTYAAIRWRRDLLMALPFLVTLNGVSPRISNSSIRLDQLAATLLVIPLLTAALAGRRRIRLDTVSWWLLALLASNVAASLLNSPVPWFSVRQCLNLGSTWVIYVLLINFLENLDELEAFLIRVVWAAVAASAIGIVAFLLGVMGVPVGGADVSAAAAAYQTTAYGAYGTMIEPNIFGNFAAAQLMLVVALLLAAPRESTPINPRLLRWAVALTATALVLSFTRGAWLGAAAGMGCLMVLSGRLPSVRFRIGRIVMAAAAASVIVAVLLVLPGDTGTIFRFKVVNLFNLASSTAMVRWFSWAMALEQSFQHPVMGWGTFTFAAITTQGVDFQSFENWRNLWIGNYLLLAFHDTGVVGLALLVGALATVIGRALRVLKTMSMEDRKHASRVVGLVASVTTFLVSFFATTGFTLGYSWLVVGLLGAYCRVLEQRGTRHDMAQ